VSLGALGALLLVGCYLAVSIYAYSDNDDGARADAAVVLGAAVWSDEPSPVFRERINHAVELYRRGRVRKIIFTGARGSANEPAEAVAARAYAATQGVPASAILLETKSHTTYQNLLYAKRVADVNGLRRVLIVSDPMHMRRAMSMARDLGLEARPSPTPTSRYKTMGAQLGQLARETYFYAGYLAGRSIGRPD
jgi:uncharacterized SAM-binding protein YcdF (DUF218 family)